MVLVLDDIRSLYNVGSIFRTADGFGVGKIFLCGITGTPDQHGVRKVSLGAEAAVAWEKRGSAWRTVEELKSRGYTVIGLERSEQAADIRGFRPEFPLALVLGNEIRGITPAMGRRLHGLVEIPMVGVKESFNVAVACGIALYHVSRFSFAEAGDLLY